MRQLTKAEQCRALMYKRSAVARLNYSEICDSLYDMTSMCCDIKYAEQDDDTLINAFDGNEDYFNFLIWNMTLKICRISLMKCSGTVMIRKEISTM